MIQGSDCQYHDDTTNHQMLWFPYGGTKTSLHIHLVAATAAVVAVVAAVVTVVVVVV